MKFNALKLCLITASFMAVSGNCAKTIATSPKEVTPEVEEIEDRDSLAEQQTASTNSGVFQTGYYAPYYFKNLNTNFGYNTFGSCGYIAVGMLLSFWDTYWDDSIVPEKYEEQAKLSSDAIDINVNSPGVKREPTSLRYGTAAKYHENITNYRDEYLHFLLLDMGKSLFNTTAGNYGMSSGKYVRLINNYLTNYRDYSTGDYEIVSTSTNVRSKAISYIKQGIPVQLSIGGHAVVAYDYDEDTDNIYCHFGWDKDSTHVTIESMGYTSYANLTAIKFNGKHTHSDNYKYTSGSTVKNHCPCEIGFVKNVSISAGISNKPTYKIYYPFENERWFTNTSLKVEYILNEQVVGSSTFYGKAFTMPNSVDSIIRAKSNTSSRYEIRITYPGDTRGIITLEFKKTFLCHELLDGIEPIPNPRIKTR